MRSAYTGNDYLLRYAGQSFANFCNYFDNLNWHAFTLRRVLPLSSYLLGGKWSLAEYDIEVLDKTGMELGQFSTMMGTFFIDIGTVGLLVYSLIYNRLMEAIIQDVIEYINDAIRCAMMDPAATLLVFMLLVLIIITPGRKAADRALMALTICFIYLILTSNVLATLISR